MFCDIPRNVWGHFPECLRIFPGMFEDISRNVWGHFPECLRTFPRMFGDILRNVWGHSPHCLKTLPRMFGDIPQNVWRHSSEYNIPPIPRVPRIPFPVPVFLVLYMSIKRDSLNRQWKRMVASFSNFYGKIWGGFCLNIRKRVLLEFSF